MMQIFLVLDQCCLMHYFGFSAGCRCACPTTPEEISGSGTAQLVTMISLSSALFNWANFNVYAINKTQFVCYWIVDGCSCITVYLCAQTLIRWGYLQVMTSGQRVPFEFYGTNYVFTVNQALLEGQENSTPLDRGFLSSDTYIIFEAAPNSGIKVLSNTIYTFLELILMDVAEALSIACNIPQ